MYLPGLEKMLLFFVLMLAVLSTFASGAPTPLALLIALLGTYFTYVNREALVEVLYGERALLLLGLERIIFKKNYVMVLFKKRNLCILSSFLKVIDIDFPDSDAKLGEEASRIMSVLHIPSTTFNVIAIPRRENYSYYLKVNSVCRREHLHAAVNGFLQLVSEVERRLAACGVYTLLANPSEALPELVSPEVNSYGPAPPYVLLSTLLSSVLLYLLAPGLVLLALIPVPVILEELKLVKGGKVPLRFAPLTPLSSVTSDIPESSSLGSSLRVLQKLFVQCDEPIIALVAPQDLAELQAKVSKALEVLEAGRAGASKLSDEFKAVTVFEIYRAVEEGQMPFKVELFSKGPVWRLESLGLRQSFHINSLIGKRAVLQPARAVLGLPGGPHAPLRVSSQIAWLSPYTFVRAATRRTPRAIYLGRGTRKGEKVYLEIDALENAHGLIIGPMGSGKSTTARALAVRAIEQGIVPVIVDPSGEYRAFANRYSFNIVDLADRPINPLECRVEDLEKSLGYISPLNDYEVELLRRCLDSGVEDFAGLIRSTGNSSLSWKLRRVEPYYSEPLTSLRRLLEARRPLVLCMGSSASGGYRSMPLEVQQFTFSIALAQMRDHALGLGLSEPRWLLIVDEAHLFMRPPEGYLEPEVVTTARMLRKFGLAVVLLTHDWGDVPESFRRTAGWKLALSHSDPDYISLTQIYMALSPSELAWLRRGIRGRAVLRRGLEPHNILVEIEPLQA